MTAFWGCFTELVLMGKSKQNKKKLRCKVFDRVSCFGHLTCFVSLVYLMTQICIFFKFNFHFWHDYNRLNIIPGAKSENIWLSDFLFCTHNPFLLLLLDKLVRIANNNESHILFNMIMIAVSLHLSEHICCSLFPHHVLFVSLLWSESKEPLSSADWAIC